MKVLSLQEPYATLILYGKKQIETRSWKTDYRGEILIHASLSKAFLKSIQDPYVLELIKDMPLNYGSIICKATLVDCKKMTKEFVKEMKNNKMEYSLGIYTENRYAWYLENIVPLFPKVEVKGHLGLWEYKDYQQK